MWDGYRVSDLPQRFYLPFIEEICKIEVNKFTELP